MREANLRHLAPIVALLAEGVDRNNGSTVLGGCDGVVALLTEGVDRNETSAQALPMAAGRPPHGGRGEKCVVEIGSVVELVRRPPRGGRG